MRFLRKQAKSYDRAMGWFKANMVSDKGIIVHTRQPVPYPEVTGYFVPTLYQWGEAELARTCTTWLLSVQLPDGAFPAPDGVPIPSTPQVIRSWRRSARRARRTAIAEASTDGAIARWSPQDTVDGAVGDIASDLIHSYAIFHSYSPDRSGETGIFEAGRFVQSFYKAQAPLAFNRLALTLCDGSPWELGEIDRQAGAWATWKRSNARMAPYPATQTSSGCVPQVSFNMRSSGTDSATPNVPTVRWPISNVSRTSPGLFR
jgi:hypothetical protein